MRQNPGCRNASKAAGSTSARVSCNPRAFAFAEHAEFVGCLVTPYTERGLELYAFDPAASDRLHTIWYAHRRTPSIAKVPAVKDALANDTLGALDLDKDIAPAVDSKVPPVGQAGQPVRKQKNRETLLTIGNARLKQWCAG